MPISTLLVLSLLPFSSLVLAMGPHYLSNHDAEMSLLARRSSSAVDSNMGHRALGRKRHFKKKRSTCKSTTKSNTGSSTSNNTGSTTSNTNTGSTSSGTADKGSSDTGKTTDGSDGGSTIGGSTSSTGATGSAAAALSQLISSTGITAFISGNSGGIGSWYNTNSGTDSTNGHSWCGYPYNNDTPGFAPDVSLMLANFDGDYQKAAKAYCGLEAIVTGSNGATKTMYIADGFDHRWVRYPGSIDIIKGSFAALFGSSTDDKNDVIRGISWTLTGNRNPQYAFKGEGN